MSVPSSHDLGAAPPPPNAALEAALAGLTPRRPRRPARDLAAVLGCMAMVIALPLMMMGLRHDLAGLPASYAVGVGAVWLVLAIALAALVVLPRRGQVLQRPRLAGAIGVAGVVLVVGLGAAVQPPGALAGGALLAGHGCLDIGAALALLPIGCALLLLRRAVPSGNAWLGAGLGAAGGAAPGLMLHLHCPNGDALHLAFMHGGVVVLATALGAVLAARITRP